MKSLSAFFLLLFLLTTFPAVGQPVMSPIWQRHWNAGQLFDPNNPDHAPGADPDFDGWTNLAEYHAGTDPFRANPPLGHIHTRIRHVPAVWGVLPDPEPEDEPWLETPEAFEIECIAEGTPGKTYQLFYSEDLSPGSWTPVGPPIPGDGTEIILGVFPQYEDDTLVPHGFWRLEISETLQDTDNDGIIDSDEWLLGSSVYLEDTDDNGIDDYTQYHGGQHPAGGDGGQNGPGNSVDPLYSVVFQVVEEQISQPTRGYQPFTAPAGSYRYLTREETDLYSVSGSPRYGSVSGGHFKRTFTYLENGSIITGNPLSTLSGEEGQRLSDWKSANGIPLGQGESISWSDPQIQQGTPLITTGLHETTKTTTTGWEVMNDDDVVVRSGTETIVEIKRITLKDRRTWQEYWEQHVSPLSWKNSPPGEISGPLGGVDYIRAYHGDASAAEQIRERFRRGDTGFHAIIAAAGRYSLGAGGSTRLKSLRWRWVRFNPLRPFQYQYAAPPAGYHRTFHFLVNQSDHLSYVQGSAIESGSRIRSILGIQCHGGNSGWQEVPASLTNPFKIEKALHHDATDFSKWGTSSVTTGTTLYVDEGPAVLAVNVNFDEGNTGDLSANRTGAVPDLKTPSLAAARTSVDGRVQAGEIVTEDLYQGWFGIPPNGQSPGFFEDAIVTIRKVDVIDPETGKRQSGQIRLHATWGEDGERNIEPYDIIQDILVGNASATDLTGLFYGGDTGIPGGARFWIEGLYPGSITLEFRYQKGDVDFTFQRGFEIQCHWTRDKWTQAVRDEVYLDSFTNSGGAGINGVVPGTGTDMGQFSPAGEFLDNRPYVCGVYEFYTKLHDMDHGKFFWAGLAKRAGVAAYAGLSDAQNGRAGVAIGTFGIVDVAALKRIQEILLQANLVIFEDLAYQFVAYRSSGIRSMEYLNSVSDIAPEAWTAWQKIDQGILNDEVALVAAGNKELLEREQNIILERTYLDLDEMNVLFGTTSVSWLFSVLAKNPVIGGPRFTDVVPGGNIANFDHRWQWITNETNGMWKLWLDMDSATRRGWAAVPLRTAADSFNLLAPIR